MPESYPMNAGNGINSYAKNSHIQGLVSEDQVDSFNLPVYAPTPMEITELVERNGCFTIEGLEFMDLRTEADSKIDARASAMHMRAGFENIISKHFGSDVSNDLFDRHLEKVKESFDSVLSNFIGGSQLSVVLKRK
ncbi:SAM dependent carboxyl methyltransferase [Corchorus olitorius]|uniref:SAM dependent carboxyl methyltransferase n=1 Tax=Corchorus olitorius TaxID=93759 RepID=A0A1R3HPY5_9ROSI|nr:SAM dependent carboxyl methyltransferase [Corchorus olitorius]